MSEKNKTKNCAKWLLKLVHAEQVSAPLLVRAHDSTKTMPFLMESVTAREETEDEEMERRERDKIREERRRERERDFRLEQAGKKTKYSRDSERDVSEKIALGQAKASGTSLG